MRLPAFLRRENSIAARNERSDAVEKMVSRSLRGMASLLTRAAELVEKQRLQRAGYTEQGRFLERTDKKP